jgi:hypothetical protein
VAILFSLGEESKTYVERLTAGQHSLKKTVKLSGSIRKPSLLGTVKTASILVKDEIFQFQSRRH